jgi:hypothetical protein
MPYRIRWQLVGRSGQLLDSGCLAEGVHEEVDAVVAVAEFLRRYPSVSHCYGEGYWVARGSKDADLVVWIWVEGHETDESTETSPQSSVALLSV